MFASIASFFDDTNFMPHGMCLLWRPDILWTHVVADALITAAYFSIPAALIYFAYHRRDFPHIWILHLFGAFIIWCGISHAASIWTFWVPAYGVQAIIKAITAIVSVTTAVMLWPLMPRALRIPSLSDLQTRNALMKKEIGDRLSAEHRLNVLTATLERRVAERTAELSATNARLEAEVALRRRIEEQLLKAKSEAEAANRTKTVFLAGMSHELRSPLNAILGFCQMLDQVYDHGLDARQRAYLKDIYTSGGALLEFIERLLDLSMVESGRFSIKVEPTDLGACLEKAHTILVALAQQAGIELHMTTPVAGSAMVFADSTRLLQIVLNVGTNAIKYNRPQGRVDISVHDVSDTQIAVRIADTGLGIPAQFQDKVFQAFNRLNQDQSQVHGTGIGLALSKRLAEAMGANLKFESVDGDGTVFELVLLRADV